MTQDQIQALATTTVTLHKSTTGLIATLTTDAPGSTYNAGVLRFEGGKADEWPDYGPSDVLPTGIRAAEYVRRMVTHDWSGYDDDEIPPRPIFTDAEIALVRRFLQRWPDGPQL